MHSTQEGPKIVFGAITIYLIYIKLKKMGWRKVKKNRDEYNNSNYSDKIIRKKNNFIPMLQQKLFCVVHTIKAKKLFIHNT